MATETKFISLTGLKHYHDTKVKPFLDGENSVPNADSATYATNAGTASYAENTGSATYATSAGTAENATSASVANHATSADSATNASSATHAATAGHATSADSATNAVNATVAEKLGAVNKGSATKPIYLKAGVPTECGFTVEKSVPADAEFTDTTYGVATTTTHGLIKAGGDITISADGIVSVKDDSHNHTIENVDGLSSLLDTFETKANATATYETKANATATYLTKTDATATYETKSNATATYLTKTDASNTYETKANTSATYETKNDSSLKLQAAKDYADAAVAALVNGAPADLDTLNELAEALEDNKDIVDVLRAAIGEKVGKTEWATNTTGGIVKLGTATTATISGQNYPVGLTANKQMYVNVPWIDTKYAAGKGLALNGTTFSNAGVRSITPGTANGTISVNTNGTTTDVAVTGLGPAAYKNATSAITKGSTDLVTSGAVYSDLYEITTVVGTVANTLKSHKDSIDSLGVKIDSIKAATDAEIDGLFK